MLAVDQYPLKLASWVHPQLQGESRAEERRSMCGEFFRRNPCCLDGDFSCKVRCSFKTYEEVEENTAFLDALHTWATNTRLTNMHLERLLAGFRRNVTRGLSRAPNQDRVVSVGFLTQLMNAHLEAGGDDPRVVSRANLLRSGAAINSRQDDVKTRPPSGFVPFLVEQRAAYRQQRNLQKLSKPQNDEDRHGGRACKSAGMLYSNDRSRPSQIVLRSPVCFCSLLSFSCSRMDRCTCHFCCSRSRMLRVDDPVFACLRLRVCACSAPSGQVLKESRERWDALPEDERTRYSRMAYVSWAKKLSDCRENNVSRRREMKKSGPSKRHSGASGIEAAQFPPRR